MNTLLKVLGGLLFDSQCMSLLIHISRPCWPINTHQRL